MSHIRPEDARYPPGPPSRPFPRRDDKDGRMYDDNSPTRSRSPGGTYNLPAIIFNNVTSNTRTGLTHFLQFTGPSRTPPRRPAADRRRDYPRDHSDSRSRYRSRDLDEPRRRSSRSTPRRPRHGYRDRDREGYRSRSRSRSYSRSRSRSPRRGRPHYGQESREVMMDGLPVDMAEEDVGQLLPSLFVPLISSVS